MICLTGVDLRAVHEAQRSSVTPPEWTPPAVLPPAWEQVHAQDDGGAYRSETLGLLAIISCTIEQDGRAWIHLSVSHRARIPTWRELREAKEIFLGDREAYQVMPPRARYVNIHPHVLHMFALIDRDAVALPDFTRGTRSL